MIKRILVVAMILILVLSLAGCGGNTTTPKDTKEDTVGTKENPKDKKEETSKQSTGGLPDNLEDLAIVLEGNAITLPMTFEDLLALGWTAASVHNLDEAFKPKQELVATIFNDAKSDKFIFVTVINLSDNQDSILRQTAAVGLEVRQDDLVIELPQKIVKGVSTKDDVIAAFGEPDEGDTSAVYKKANYSVYIGFASDTGVIDAITIVSKLN